MSGAAHQHLLAAARTVRQHAFAPYSKFRVGAALLDANGGVWTGCNVESASYGLTICAERVAIGKAVSEGVRRFVCVAVVADTPQPTPPCGACRQLLWEFGGDLEIVLGDLAGPRGVHRLGALLPLAFDGGFLDTEGKA